LTTLDILVNILKENAVRTYDDGYGGVSAFDWWLDIASESKNYSQKMLQSHEKKKRKPEKNQIAV
jgi:hypothetical protein